jgi:guanine deaminase
MRRLAAANLASSVAALALASATACKNNTKSDVSGAFGVKDEQTTGEGAAPTDGGEGGERVAPAKRAFRASLLTFSADPAEGGEAATKFIADGLMVVEGGKITAVGPYAELQATVGNAPVVDYTGRIIVPGFIDTHVHFPQTEMIGAFGEELLKWLETYTFPTEKQFQDKEYARSVARVFLKELLRNGTTTALVFASVHKESAAALFEEADKLGMRLIIGKVLMDRNAPEYLRDTPETAYADSKALIDTWHKKGRNLYAITPRFAPTSSPAQLEAAKRLVAECPDCYMHTHVSENKGEIAWVKELFDGVVPAGTSYLGVYDHFGLMTPRAVFAHAVHFEDADFQLLAQRQSAIAFCPTSNLFLGSGLFKLADARRFKAKVGLGTDIGAGTSFSMLQTLNEAYKVVKLQGGKLSAVEGLYLATLGSARALSLEDRIGSLRAGGEADFAVLDPAATPLLKFRTQKVKDWQELLFVLMTLGDDRSVAATYVAGRLAHTR